jgi:hypothetical protein
MCKKVRINVKDPDQVEAFELDTKNCRNFVSCRCQILYRSAADFLPVLEDCTAHSVLKDFSPSLRVKKYRKNCVPDSNPPGSAIILSQRSESKFPPKIVK